MDIVRDEIDLLQSLVPLQAAKLLELGCGKAEFARKLADRTPIAALTALEVDRTQHKRNLEGPAHPKITFGYGGAEGIPFDDATFDGVLMMKSLHHVPVAQLDVALREIARVLKPAGWLYVSEPVYAGALNDIIKLFHDEGEVRAAAYEALQRAVREGVLAMELERSFEMPAHYRSYDDFVAKHVDLTHSRIAYPEAVATEVRTRLDRHMTPQGADFLRPMRVNLLRRAA